MHEHRKSIVDITSQKAPRNLTDNVQPCDSSYACGRSTQPPHAHRAIQLDLERVFTKASGTRDAVATGKLFVFLLGRIHTLTLYRSNTQFDLHAVGSIAKLNGK